MANRYTSMAFPLDVLAKSGQSLLKVALNGVPFPARNASRSAIRSADNVPF